MVLESDDYSEIDLFKQIQKAKQTKTVNTNPKSQKTNIPQQDKKVLWIYFSGYKLSIH